MALKESREVMLRVPASCRPATRDREKQEEKETLVDRAWKAIVSSLKNMVGGGPEPFPSPA